jgi:hypothetical protein
MMLVMVPRRSRFVSRNWRAAGISSERAEAPFILAIVVALRRAASQRDNPSSSR